jgi:DNA-binding NarL/FixJ family response regulator
MPSLNGIELTKKAICSPPKPAVVLCSVESHPEIIQHALNAGALAYVFKPRIATDLVAAVKSAAAGRQFVSHV